jgi:hypothetical protein
MDNMLAEAEKYEKWLCRTGAERMSALFGAELIHPYFSIIK